MSSISTVYDDLRKFFSLRSRDGYLNSADGATQGPSASAESNGSLKEAYDTIFSEREFNYGIEEICKAMQAVPRNTCIETFCVTPFNETQVSKLKDVNTPSRVPLHNASITGKREQGIAVVEIEQRDRRGKTIIDKKTKLPVTAKQRKKCSEQEASNYQFTVSDINKDMLNPENTTKNPVSVIQVFPVSKSPDLSDTEIITLHLSTIHTVNMSLAVPFVDIAVSVESETGSPISEAAFSFGNFLNPSSQKGSKLADLAGNADFVDQSLSGYGYREKKDKEGNVVQKSSIRTVASMEVFTSPQTLVNSENVSYNENTSSGMPIDVFRPYMAIESLNFTVVPGSAGLIAYKTANVKIRLFDRGRLGSIAPIVAPSRFGLVKFDIEYGWSHPAGSKIGRTSDSQITDRIGQLIDAMRTKESYQVVNSSFSFEQDGSVSIDLKLSMLGNSYLRNSSIKFTADDADAAELVKQFEEVKKLLASAPKSVNVPATLTGDVDSLLDIDKDEAAEINGFLNVIAKTGGNTAGASAIAKLLYGKKDRRGQLDPAGSFKSAFQASRKEKVAKMIQKIISTPDPWLRYEGLAANAGVKSEEITSNNYVSLGKVIVNSIGPILQDQGEVIFIFGSFNQDAGAMFDHNIAQFPIKISATGNGSTVNEVTLQSALERRLSKITKITPEVYLKIINEEFLLREYTEAYGLSSVYGNATYNEKDEVQIAYQANLQKQFQNPKADDLNSGDQLLVETKKIENIVAIYGQGKRSRPTFTLPRLTMRIDAKPRNPSDSSSTRPIIKVIITDQAASSIGDVHTIFDNIMSQGFFFQDDYSFSGSQSVRGAQHGVVSSQVIQKLVDATFVKKPEPKDVIDNIRNFAKIDLDTSDDKLKNDLGKLFVVNDAVVNDSQKLRSFFYNFFPTLIFGSEGSGILTAQLSSNQNDALTTMMMQSQGNIIQKNTGLPMMIHPTQLSIDVFGTPLFKYSQKFFVDFGTNTTADNFYVITGIDMSFSPGEYKTSLKMTLLEGFGKFMKVRDGVWNTLISLYKWKTTPSTEGVKKNG